MMGTHLAIELDPKMGGQIFKLYCPKGYSKLDMVSISKRSNLRQNRTLSSGDFQNQVLGRVDWALSVLE